MTTIKVNEIVRDSFDWKKDKIYKIHTVTGSTLAECFPKVYAFERSSRYDSNRRYEIADTELHNAYLEWKETGVTIEMYYGSATVD